MRELKKRLCEQDPVVVNTDTIPDAENKTQRQIATEFKGKHPEMSHMINNGDVTLGTNAKGATNEGRTFTKKQIKEERVRNLKKQCVRVTKKNLR